jgi:hypothetical protein
MNGSTKELLLPCMFLIGLDTARRGLEKRDGDLK